MLGEEPGTFVDVGCQDPFTINNTAMLEALGWRGIAIDVADRASEWRVRRTPFVRADALTMDFPLLLSEHGLSSPIGYLSIDLQELGSRVRALERIMGAGVLFHVVTIEHDAYKGPEMARAERTPQRRLLGALGYELVCADIGRTTRLPQEDWWVHPGAVPADRYAPFVSEGQAWAELFAKAGVERGRSLADRCDSQSTKRGTRSSSRASPISAENASRGSRSAPLHARSERLSASGTSWRRVARRL